MEFSFSDLKRKAETEIYIYLPPEQLDICSKWFRVVAAAMINGTLNEELEEGR